MATLAPPAISGGFDTLANGSPLGLILSGIVGDTSHVVGGGYHISRDDLIAHGQTGDYSIQLPQDKLGPGNMAAALDIKPADVNGMRTLTQRLIDAYNASDPRTYPLREFYGTTDGVHVTGRDFVGRYFVSSDTTHLWHLHLSFLRQWCNDQAAINGVMAILGNDVPVTVLTPIGEDDMHMVILQDRNSGKQFKTDFDTVYAPLTSLESGLLVSAGAKVLLTDANGMDAVRQSVVAQQAAVK